MRRKMQWALFVSVFGPMCSRSACTAESTEWCKVGLRILRIAINLCIMTLGGWNIIRRLQNVCSSVQRNGGPPQRSHCEHVLGKVWPRYLLAVPLVQHLLRIHYLNPPAECMVPL
jgi:hypothetical protein